MDLRTKSAKSGMQNRYRNQLKSPKSFDNLGKKRLMNRSNKVSKISNMFPSKLGSGMINYNNQLNSDDT